MHIAPDIKKPLAPDAKLSPDISQTKKQALDAQGVEDSKVRQLISGKLKSPYSINSFIRHTKATAESPNAPSSNLAKDVQAILTKKTDVSHQELQKLNLALNGYNKLVNSIFPEVINNLEALETQAENNLSTIQDGLRSIDKKSQHQKSQHQKKAPLITTLPEAKSLETRAPAEKLITSTVEFQSTRQDGFLESSIKELSLSRAGEIIEAGKVSKNTEAIFVNNGRAFDKAGNEITSFKWGNGQLESKHLELYLEPLSENSLSGVKDGFLKNLSFNGKQAVFIKGSPPPAQHEVLEAKPETAKLEKTELEFPAAPVAEKNNKPILTSRNVNLQTEVQGKTYSQNVTLRLGSDRSLQMKFGQESSSTWLDPSNAPQKECCCLYCQNGKVLDASGKEVKNLNWGKSFIQSGVVLDYVEPLENGKISSVKSGYLNEVRHNGKHVVFTKGAPPFRAKVSTVHISSKQNNGSYSGKSFEFKLNEQGTLQVREQFSKRWNEATKSQKQIGQNNLNFKLLYSHEGKLYNAKAQEISSLALGEQTIDAKDFNAKVFAYTSKQEQGAVYGIGEPYLADLRHGDSHVLFVDKKPPGLSLK